MDEMFKKVNYKEFEMALKEAKDSLSERDSWRVSAYTAEHYEDIKAKCYVSKMGSTVAIDMNGDIISVCRHGDDTMVRGKDLIEFAKQQNGYKIPKKRGKIHGCT